MPLCISLESKEKEENLASWVLCSNVDGPAGCSIATVQNSSRSAQSRKQKTIVENSV